ncbi:ERF family protein [Micromonospora sp. NPDC047730]|uniref:ERF family protein n=1 Tax=Micromonospora sp. NPDC047730 TaxID=3364253 RepID=UPI00371CFEC3
MTAPTTSGLAAALAKVQAELPEIDRDRTVTVETKKGDPYSYSYVTLAHLSKTILPLLAKHGLAFAAMPGAGSDGKMCVRYTLMHESGESLSGEFPISGEGGIQMIGGRITYARRYCLAALVGVAADEDDESRLSEDGRPATAQRAAARPRQQQPPAPAEEGQTAQRAQRPARPAAQPPLPGEQPAKLSDSQRGMLMGQFTKLGIEDRTARLRTMTTLLGRQVESANDLTRAEASDLINVLAAALESDDPRTVLLEALAAAAAAAGGEGQ